MSNKFIKGEIVKFKDPKNGIERVGVVKYTPDINRGYGRYIVSVTMEKDFTLAQNDLEYAE